MATNLKGHQAKKSIRCFIRVLSGILHKRLQNLFIMVYKSFAKCGQYTLHHMAAYLQRFLHVQEVVGTVTCEKALVGFV